MLIPWLKAKIAAHYPGTKLSFSEYTFGGGHDISGGVAEADALGIFGREGLDMATSWNWADTAGDNQYEIAALRAFRNYDGNGAHFGDTSVHGVTTDDAKSSVYASLDSGSHLVTIVAINKTTGALKAGIEIAAPAVSGFSIRTLTSAGPTLQSSSATATMAAAERLHLHHAGDVGLGAHAARAALGHRRRVIGSTRSPRRTRLSARLRSAKPAQPPAKSVFCRYDL